jgi:hypothetical protein
MSSELFLAIQNKNTNAALDIIHNNNFDPDQLDETLNTPLMLACNNKMSDVAFALIQSGKSKPGHVNDDNETALEIACNRKMPKESIELIQSGESNPGHVNDFNETAILIAYKRNLTDVVIALIQTGQSNLTHIDARGKTVIDYILHDNKLTLIPYIKPFMDKTRIINVNALGYDFINSENIQIRQYLAETPDNLCFSFEQNHFLVNKETIRIQLSNNSNIKYGCKKAGNQLQYQTDKNIIRDYEYFALSSIFGVQMLVNVKDIKDIVDSSPQLYILHLFTFQTPTFALKK